MLDIVFGPTGISCGARRPSIQDFESSVNSFRQLALFVDALAAAILLTNRILFGSVENRTAISRFSSRLQRQREAQRPPF